MLSPFHCLARFPAERAAVRPWSTGPANARASTKVTSGGAAVSGATANVRVRDPSGAVTTLTGQTDSSGLWSVDYPLSAASAPGPYTVTSTATLGALTTTASGSFSVQ